MALMTITTAIAGVVQKMGQQKGLMANSAVTTNSVMASTSAEVAASAVAAAGGNGDGDVQWLGVTVTPEGRSVLCMAMAMAMHFFGYEFARNASLALFTSRRGGFAGASGLSLAMACVTPASFVMLMGYGQQLDRYGPRLALRHTTLFCAAAFPVAGTLIAALEEAWPTIRVGNIEVNDVPVLKIVLFASFLLQNSYAHLLYTQHWSFIGSVLSPAQGATWFSSISGVSSITSTMAAVAVSRLVDYVSLPLLFGVATGLSLLVSLFFAERAYSIAEQFGFTPKKEQKVERTESRRKSQSTKSNINNGKENVVEKASRLFVRVPALKLLFCEVVSFQSLATLLNICLIGKLKTAVPQDAERAAWTGKFWAVTNAASGCLQFIVLPLLFKVVDPSVVWVTMPVVILLFTIFQCLQVEESSLYLVSCAFFLAKTIDYSLRGVISEMVYASLDFESRYLGKEVVGVFGNRLGKSGTSLVLSGLTAAFGNFGLNGLSYFAALASFSWLAFALRLGSVIPEIRTAEPSDKPREGKVKKKLQ